MVNEKEQVDRKTCEKIDTQLAKGLLSGRLLLSRTRMLDENSRLSPPYTDPHYIPFYYYFGQHVQPKNVVEVGLRLGLCSSTLFRTCKTVDKFLAFQEKGQVFYSPRMAIHNIRDYYKGNLTTHVGKITDDKFINVIEKDLWDLALINEETTYDTHLSYLEILWNNMRLNGTILIEYVNYHDYVKKAYFDFCKKNNREPYVFKTRYGVGVITK